MASSISQFGVFLKNYFNPQRIEDLTKSGKPFLGRITKNENVGGDAWIVPILIGNGQGVSAISHAQAQTSASNILGVKWSITMGNYFGSVSIGDKVIQASRGNEVAFLQNRKAEIEGLYETFSNSIAQYLWRNGGGALASVGAISGNNVTLAQSSDAFHFEVNEVVAACADDGTTVGTTPRVGTTFITAVDRINGVLTLNSVAGITALAVGDFLFRAGDVVANTGTVLMHGVQAYVTPGTPGALWTVTRTTDVQRLSGCKVTAAAVAGKSLEERIKFLGAKMAGAYRAMTSGGNYDCYVHPEDWQVLEQGLNARGMRPLQDDTTKFGYEYIECWTGGKKVKVFADPYCPKGSCFLLRMDNWVLGSIGKLIQTDFEDGLPLLRAATTNDYEYRLKSYPETSCNAPGFSGFVPAS